MIDVDDSAENVEVDVMFDMGGWVTSSDNVDISMEG